MKYSYFHEDTLRGTADFPLEFYHLSENSPRYIMQTHWHKDIEIIRVLQGVFEAQVGDSLFTIKAGDSIYIPSGVAHGGEPKDCIYECIVFSPAIMYSTQKIRTIIKSKILYPVIFREESDVDDLFEKFIQKQEGFELEIISHLHKIAFSALKNQTPQKSNAEYRANKIKPAILFIEKNFSSNISLSSLARECSMSPNYFCRIFKEVTGHTPFEYITTYRIEAACEMLLSDKSVTDTAYDCGFNDLSYFIHIFKKSLGVSPKKYSIEAQKNTRH